MNKPLAGVLGAVTLLLAACGGGGGGGGGGFLPPPIVADPGPGTGADTGRGSLVSTPPSQIVRLSADQFASLLKLDAQGRGLLQVAGDPKCGIDLRYMEYRTVGGKGEATNATAAVMMPSGTDAACNGPRPIVLYAHGTTTDRNYNIAKFVDPDNAASGEGATVAAMFAARGYIVVAPNYAGYDKSALAYHPYLNGEQNGREMVDALAAARKALPAIGGASDAGTLLVTGYSQGGYVALAAHREMQAIGRPPTASAPLSAPSAISLLIDATFLGAPALGGTAFLPLLASSWQQQFGNVYNNTNDIFEAQYAAGIDTLLPSATKLPEGRLPQLALFPADAKPGPANASFALFYGANNLVRQSFLTQAVNDIAANPCPGNAFPPTEASLRSATPINCTPQNGFRKAAVANDLRNWVPARPILMCGGANDPTVSFNSTRATAGYFNARGVPSGLVTVVDLEANGTSDAYSAARAGFAQNKAVLAAGTQGSDTDKSLAVIRAYHGTLVPPFCLASARGFFEGVLAAGSPG